jgi:pseudouridine-5'-phosphate glycosidase
MIDITTNPEVQQAMQDKKPIVALESTIISHGLPFPENYKTAIALEQEVRKQGVVPATIAIINGCIKVGLETEDLEILADPKSEVEKISRRDLPSIIQARGHGATTVAATMIIAAKSDIQIFATGGIGGVHRGAQTSFDISADLQELVKTNVCVVCAGPKAILDLNLTMEYLETNGVPVLGYKTTELPAFWSRNSGIYGILPYQNASEIASFLSLKWGFPLAGGALVTNPVSDADEIPELQVRSWIEEALNETRSQKVTGKEITPFILDYIRLASKGRSVKTNISLVKNNAKLAAQIAIELKKVN